MNREWQKKRKHVTTPVPCLNRWFSIQVKSRNTSKKSLGKESFKKIAQSQAVMNAVTEADDAFHFTSQSSSEENNTDIDSCCASAGSEVTSSEEEDAFPSPEKRRYRDSICCEKEISPEIHNSASYVNHQFVPVLTSSRIQNSIEDTNPVFGSADLERDKKRTIVHSYYQDLEDEYKQTPKQIDENYVKYRSWEDYKNENIEDLEGLEDLENLEDIEIPLQEPNLLSINRSVQSNFAKRSKQRESLELNKDSSSCKRNGSKSQHSSDKFSTSAINNEDTVDNVFENFIDTRNLMSNGKSGFTSKEICFDELSQIANERSNFEVPESLTVTKKKPKEAKSLMLPEISIRKKKVSRMRSKRKVSTSVKVIAKLTKEEVTELEKELQSIPICPLSLTKIPFSRCKRLED